MICHRVENSWERLLPTRPDKSFRSYEEIMKSQARSPWGTDREVGNWTWWITPIILILRKLRQKVL